MNSNQGEAIRGIRLETILLYNIEELITEYEPKIFQSLVKKEYDKCGDYLSDFCFELLELTDEEQVFITRTFFTSLITDIIRVQTRKNQLHPKMLSYAYETIATIEKYENITEYLLYIPTFLNQISTYIIGDHLIIEGNIHVEKALQLINYHLASDVLTVRWIAEQLDISTTHLSNVFKLQMGETITKFIMKRKIDEIAFEIQHSNDSINNIRAKYGFVNHSHFIQQFKKMKGITPLQYKQQLFYD